MDFWARHNAAVVFVTHDLEEGLLLGDRIILLSEGRLVGERLVPFARPRRLELKYTQEFLQARIELHRSMFEDKK